MHNSSHSASASTKVNRRSWTKFWIIVVVIIAVGVLVPWHAHEAAKDCKAFNEVQLRISVRSSIEKDILKLIETPSNSAEVIRIRNRIPKAAPVKNC